ncbi:peptidase M17, leucyl aminopeptidase [Dunaliella salina]|uniref:Peptidase M17, leucyl aminopeptidase n=1 Tax=Dunaliella salina TaxID=3046 RepID=A0ABQ7G599_DUNSA|nr:peptidase M17, leucyl aminopeptidase [Dunaliella salina]|eukprot:KAF5829786.1 peptidase M17, leucyl aminopeptidase [Dunaliella salina]
MMLAGYETTRFKSKLSPTASKLAELAVVDSGSVLPSGAACEAALAKARAIAQGNFVTRYLVEAPPNVCNPTHMAAAAAHIAKQAPETMTLEVLEKEQCEAMNMGLFLGVAECSDEPPKFIHLKYTPKGGSNGKSIALVGKGLTFDSGGYNIKAGPGSLIEMMKFDMGGAGATLGAARIISALQPQGGPEVHFLVASCENMVAGHGLRPGDVLTSASGKTVEVNNTDAEGRLTLADALWFAQEKCGATAIVDSATLTGACLVALGDEIAGLMSPTDAAAADVVAAAKTAGEKMWRLPMEDSYFDQLKSSIADMKNTGGRFGGSITASLFLKQFIQEGVQWSHVDMPGPVWDWKLNLPTGFGAATLAEWVLVQGKK